MEARQRDFLEIGQQGCLVFSLIHLAEGVTGAYVDAWRTYTEALSQGLIRVDCYVNDIAALFGRLTSQRWICLKMDPDYVVANGELLVLRYEKQGTVSTVTHFVCEDYDPLALDLNAKKSDGSPVWTLAKKYILRRLS